MTQWTGNSTPNWYKDIDDATALKRPNHPADEGSLIKDDRGWVRQVRYTDQHGNSRVKEYVEVADRELLSDSPQLYVTDIRIGNGANQLTSYPQSTPMTFEVVFNQPVATPGSGTQEWGFFAETDELTGASYLSGNGTNTLTFVGTSPGNPSETFGPNTACLFVIDGYDPDTDTRIAGAQFAGEPAPADGAVGSGPDTVVAANVVTSA